MKNFDQKHIKNIVLLGSPKSGKTTLSECMLFEASLINRRGTVESHNTVSDYHEVEHDRENSVYATLMHTEWKDYKINILDTPGSDDFIGEIVASVKVADTCVMVINAQHGIEVSTEILWNYVDQFHKPTLFAINQLDHPKADFDRTVEDIQAQYGMAAVVMQYPVKTGEGFDAIIDLLKMTMYKFPADGGRPQKLEIPDDQKEKANHLHNELVEKAAENDEGLMELYFEKGNLDEDELRKGLKMGMLKHDIFPVFCVSAKQNMGSGRMMGFIDNVAPSAVESTPVNMTNGEEMHYELDKEPVVFVFKTLVEPYLGRLSVFKVVAGELKPGMELNNKQTGQSERFAQLFILDGNKREPVDKLVAGDIGATLKLKNTHTNDTLTTSGSSKIVEPMEFPEPKLRLAIKPLKQGEEEKLAEALRDIADEDQTVGIEYAKEMKQMVVGMQGELHMNVVEWKLNNIYHIDVEWEEPRIPYRETIQVEAMSNYRHKKQSGGAGQFGEVFLKIEPYIEGMPEPPKEMHVRQKEEIDLEWGGKLVFYNCIVGGVIDQRFIPSIKKGILEKMTVGPITGSNVRDVRVMVYDGKMHPVDSNDISFQIAGRMAFKKAFEMAKPKILEPIYDLQVMVPEEMMGEVMTDLQTRRSVISGMDSRKNFQVINAKVPLAELHRYSSSLKSITQGRGTFRVKFAEYSPVPANIQKSLAEEFSDIEN